MVRCIWTLGVLLLSAGCGGGVPGAIQVLPDPDGVSSTPRPPQPRVPAITLPAPPPGPPAISRYPAASGATDLAAWMREVGAVDGIEAATRGWRSVWRVGRLDAGPGSELCVARPGVDAAWCWSDEPGPVNVRTFDPWAAWSGYNQPDTPARFAVVSWPKASGPGPMQRPYRLLDLEAGTACVGGVAHADVEGRVDGSRLPPGVPDCTPLEPGPMPAWFALIGDARVEVVETSGGARALLVTEAGQSGSSLNLCLSAPGVPWRCADWQPPAEPSWQVRVLHVAALPSDGLWAVQFDRAPWHRLYGSMLAETRMTMLAAGEGGGWVTAGPELDCEHFPPARRSGGPGLGGSLDELTTLAPHVVDRHRVELRVDRANPSEETALCCTRVATAWRCEDGRCAL